MLATYFDSTSASQDRKFTVAYLEKIFTKTNPAELKAELRNEASHMRPDRAVDQGEGYLDVSEQWKKAISDVHGRSQIVDYQNNFRVRIRR